MTNILRNLFVPALAHRPNDSSQSSSQTRRIIVIIRNGRQRRDNAVEKPTEQIRLRSISRNENYRRSEAPSAGNSIIAGRQISSRIGSEGSNVQSSSLASWNVIYLGSNAHKLCVSCLHGATATKKRATVARLHLRIIRHPSIPLPFLLPVYSFYAFFGHVSPRCSLLKFIRSVSILTPLWNTRYTFFIYVTCCVLMPSLQPNKRCTHM